MLSPARRERVLLDTHALVWLLNGSERLGPAAAGQISTARDVLVSVVCLWEIEIKIAIGKLVRPPGDIATALAQGGAVRLGITNEHLAALADLPWRADHRDPFDRMLLAQAQAEHATLISADPKMYGHRVPVLPADA